MSARKPSLYGWHTVTLVGGPSDGDQLRIQTVRNWLITTELVAGKTIVAHYVRTGINVFTYEEA